MIRMAPLNSWPDNVNLDKAMRILWPAKERYGDAISWADLFILAGNIALESMGFKTLGFAGGRIDSYEEDDTYWGAEEAFLAMDRYRKVRDISWPPYEEHELENPLAATHMGLIYVNPEGPRGEADNFVGAAEDIRKTFARMAMNDEETVALIAGGHAFGKAHGNGDASKLGPAPGGASIQHTGFGWHNPNGKGNAEDTISSGLEGAWTPTPTTWDNKYLELLFKYEWQKVESPAGKQQWEPIDVQPEDMVPDAHVPGKMNKPIMLTTDLALRFGDDKYEEIAQSFLQDFDYFSDVFAKAWFKLTHRDMGPLDRYLGNEVPEEVFAWQDPIHKNKFAPLTDKDINNVRGNITKALEETNITIDFIKNDEKQTRPLDIRDLIFTAWVSASTYRDTDRRGGANGARILLEPMKSWEFVDFARVEKVVQFLTEIKDALKLDISMADLIVLAGNCGVERLARNAGFDLQMPFVSGRGDATQDQIDIESVNHLEPLHCGFLNWTKVRQFDNSLEPNDEVGLPLEDDDELRPLSDFYPDGQPANDIDEALPEDAYILEEFAEYLMIERADLLNLTVKDMVALYTGFRSAAIHHRNSLVGRDSYNRANGWKLNSDFLEHLVLKSWYQWHDAANIHPLAEDQRNGTVSSTYEHNPVSFTGVHMHPDNETALKATRVDLLFASNPILRGYCEHYTQAGGAKRLVDDFANAWNKVMMLDRYDVKR